MRRPVLASSSPRSIRSQSGSTLGRRAHPHRTVPACWQARDVPICRCWEKSARLPGLSKNQNTESCDLFHPRGHSAMARQRERSCGSWRRRRAVRSFGQTGDRPRRVVRLPTADSLCDRMERGEEESTDAPPRCISAQPFLQTSRRAGFRRAAAENFRPEIFEARATLRAQRESAVGRRIAKPHPSPVCPKDRTARLRHRNPSGPSPFARNRGMSPFTHS